MALAASDPVFSPHGVHSPLHAYPAGEGSLSPVLSSERSGPCPAGRAPVTAPKGGTGVAWLDARNAKLDEAILFLKRRCILVSIYEREAAIREYRISGRHARFMAEEVIELAERIALREARS